MALLNNMFQIQMNFWVGKFRNPAPHVQEVLLIFGMPILEAQNTGMIYIICYF